MSTNSNLEEFTKVSYKNKNRKAKLQIKPNIENSSDPIDIKSTIR